MKYSWIFTLLIAIGGLWKPKLGILVIFVMLGLTITSLFNGKYWCGNVCPHGSFFDKFIHPISKNKKIPKFIKSKYFILAFFTFFIFNFSKKAINAFSFWGSYDFLDKLGLVFVTTYITVLTIGSFLGIFITPRTWCQFCPMGTMQNVTNSVSTKLGINKTTNKKVTINNIDQCKNCGLCSKSCPIQLEPHKNWDSNMQFSNPNCIKCSACVQSCPFNILEIK